MTEKPKRWIGCPIEETYFGAEDRKAHRKERKLLSQKDRSKFKKTDSKMLEKGDELHKNIKLEKKDLCRGRVLSITSQGYIVDFEGENYTCFLRGVLKKEKTGHKNLVTVGDFVLFQKMPENEGFISHVETRRTVLSRADNLSRNKEQLIASNIDQVAITVSVLSPPLKPSLIDRYIIAARQGNMDPLIVVNKIDLLELPQAQEEKEIYLEMIEAYKKAGIPVVATSTETGEGIDELKKEMEGKATVFSGQSGVGKSSLINALAGLELTTGAIVEKTGKGSHTTTTTRLIRLDCGGFCVDTPGIKSFGVWKLERDDIQAYYSEMHPYSGQCKFNNCTHLHESGCRIIQAVEEGDVSPLRYTSYCNLMDSLKQSHKRR